jgi:predicted nuclease of predicted toxin-antitoxin system
VSDLRFLADMNISPLTVGELKRTGWDIVRVLDMLGESAKDTEVLLFARQHDMAVITQDLDFSALLAVGGHSKPTVITLRLEEPHPLFVGQRLKEIVAVMEEKIKAGAVISVDETSVRYRSLPMGAESD